MAETVIFEERTLTFSSGSDEGFKDGIMVHLAPALFELEVGETYRVVLDGTETTQVCYTAEGEVPVLGNYEGILGDGEPEEGDFLIAHIPAELCGQEGGGTGLYLMDSTGTEEHTLAIYQDVPAILLADHTGETVEHGRPDCLQVDTASGGTTKYVHERLVPEVVENVEIGLDFSEGDQSLIAPDGYAIKSVVIAQPETLVAENIREGVTIAGIEGTADVPETVETTVELDFSGGDMAVTPEDGQAFSGVNIPVPDNLIPGNIAEGIDIAGIIGTMAAGGGGGSVVFKQGSFTLSSDGKPYTLTHDLGVVPDVFVILARYPKKCGATYPLLYAWGFSSAFAARAGALATVASDTIAGVSTSSSANNLDAASSDWGAPYNATETTIDIGGTLYIASGQEYLWFAIGGLT